MAEPPSSDAGFGNREEDWPDPDVDLSTEEGAEIIRRSEAALFASMDRDAANRRRAIEATYGNLPTILYDKARDHQDQLTEAERQQLLSRGDVIGKALAYPDSLTTDEIHEARGWPPPDIVRANIQRATGGRLSTPVELYAKAKDALDHGQFDTVISDDEAFLIAHSFYAREDYCPSKCMAAHGIPGFGHALMLLSRRLGLDLAVFKACGEREFQVRERSDRDFLAREDSRLAAVRANTPTVPGSGPPQPSATTSAAPQGQPSQEQFPGEPLEAMASVQEQYRLGTLSEQEFLARMNSILAVLRARNPKRRIPVTHPPVPRGILGPGDQPPSRTDMVGSGLWPPTHAAVSGFQVFRQDTDPSSFAYTLAPDWAALPEDQKEAYRARAEALRREAWAEYERTLACKAAGLPLPPASSMLSDFEVFRDDLVAGDGGLGFWEVLARWEALTDEQRQPYKIRASQARRAALTAAVH
ncbi:hypothetical protein C8A03DRAFT_39079 [Achaetomium macrosporum]|uniref:Uncharacterized protein n=1 Tax=Achaetomium macrosporum TaxID=79813 RepID=A0AAN7C1A6_9PEZI|nr:hypothetical protein C8A03DRAFT_39079 [Achaetomium macrosporum]